MDMIKDYTSTQSNNTFYKNNEEKYAVQLGMLNSLLEEKLVTQNEYDKVKVYLKQKYKVA